MTTEEKPGLSRRDLIKKGAVAGAIVWTVPMIESVPAYAATGSTISTACSWFMLVYTVGGVTYADRVTNTGSCAGNTTSHDVQWCYACDLTHTYDNLGASDALRLNGNVIPSSGCAANTYFSVSGNTITPNTGVTINFAVAHAGSLNSSTGTEPGTPTGIGFACNNALGQSKVNVACGSLSHATFSCLPQNA